jgi:hypothetical protein
VATQRQAVLWLWAQHNAVTRRVAGAHGLGSAPRSALATSGVPAPTPWDYPHAAQCTTCRERHGTGAFVPDQVYLFLSAAFVL